MNKNQLIYLSDKGDAWIQEYEIGMVHPINAMFFSEIPKDGNIKWINGSPEIKEIERQFLVLSKIYPTTNLEFSIEKIGKQKTDERNKRIIEFNSCIKYIPLEEIEFNVVPRHIERAIYTIGLCHYGKLNPYKTIDVMGDNKYEALEKATKILKPSISERVIWVETKPNVDYDKHYNKRAPKLK